jgi:hypothetical protein
LQKDFNNQSVNRILDANINRVKEGLRVCEEITRFALNNRSLTKGLKNIRHDIDSIVKHFVFRDLLKTRNSFQDVGKTVYAKELKRGDIRDIFFANMQRAKESIRVLEEFSKLKNRSLAVKFKNIRYCLYDIEKKVSQRLISLRNLR